MLESMVKTKAWMKATRSSRQSRKTASSTLTTLIMPLPAPGIVVAVMKITPQQVEEICAQFDKTYPVNYNSPAQTVVATTGENAEAFCDAVKNAGGRAKVLPVSGAFHSPFMADAAAGLAAYMKDVDFAEPSVPVYSDYTAKPYEGDYRELVRAQVENPVR